MLLVDALREDFVAFDESSKHLRTIPEDTPERHRGDQLQVFKKLKEEQPHNTWIFPMTSASPTVTSARVKNLMNGGLSTFFEVTEEFQMGADGEDHLLH